MPLLPLKLPAIDTRLIRHNNRVYKLRLTYEYSPSGTSSHGDAPLHVSFCDPSIQEEIEKIIRVVLHRVTKGIDVCKVQTNHFLVDCLCQPWPAAKLLVFEQNHQLLQAYSEMLVLKLIAKATESMATTVVQREGVHAAASSGGRLRSSDVCKRRGKCVLQTATGRVSATARETSDMTGQQHDGTRVSTTQQVTIDAAGRKRRGTQPTHSSTSPVYCSPKPQTKRRASTRSVTTKTSPPKSTQLVTGSLSKRHASKGIQHQHYHQSDGNVDQFTPRKIKSQQCQTNGILLQQEKKQGMYLLTRPVQQRGNKALMQHEELREEMKLQHFANRCSANAALSPSVVEKQQESSLKRHVYEALDVIMTPVKKMFRKGSVVNGKP